MMELIASLPYKSEQVDNPAKWLEQLHTNGYAVVGGVADKDQVEEGRRLLWSWLAGLGTGIRREQPSTWKDRAWPDWPGMKKYGTCKSEGGAHKGATWYLRGLPSLKKVFESIYETDDLIVSMDGMIVWRPWHEIQSRKPGSSRLHIDQNPSTKPGFHCVQGMLPLYPVDAETGGTVVVPRSHEKQERLLARNPKWNTLGRDFCVLSDDDPVQGKEVLVPLEPGDLLIWDSRLVHAGRVGKGREKEELARASLCVCMGPRERASEDVLNRRKEAPEQGWSFSHWPWEARGTLGQVSSSRNKPQLTPDQLKLV